MNARLPVIGAGGGGKNGGGSSRSPVEAPDSLRSVQYARVINLLCEGEIEEIVGGAMGIYVDDTPLQNPDGTWNFVGAGIDWRSGTPDQTAIPGFAASESESSVGVQVTYEAPVVRSVTNANLNAIRITLGFPQLTEQDTENGDLNGSSVTLAIDIQRNAGGFQQVYQDTVTGKTTSRYQRSYRVELARFFGTVGGTYDIRVRRITPDSTSAYITNAFQWETMTEIVDSQLSYPYSAIVGVQVDASTFKSIPKLSFDTRMRRIQVPSNYDPATREYSGLWDGSFKTAWSDNPAWVLYDLATTERFGLGGYLSPEMVDKWTLYSIAQYCDGMVQNGFGQYEPRYTCNIYIQVRSEAIALLQQIASIFNAMLFWSGGMLTVSADMPADPVMAYTPANVIDGVFTYVGTPLNQRHTVALVTWNNPDNRYQQEIEYVEDRDAIDRWGIRELEVAALGCTSRGQAHRVGRWQLLTEQLLSETVSFKTGINAAFARPGDIFTTTDPTRAGFRSGGRIISATASIIGIDAPVTLAAGVSYTLAVLLPDGTFESRPVVVAVGETSTLTVAQAFSQVPARLSVWSLSSSQAQNEQWRCISVSEDEDGNIEIGGIAYRPDKFDAVEKDIALEPIPTGVLDPFSIGPCTELNITESKYQISPVVIGARATFSWLAPLGAVRYAVAWQFEDDSPIYADAFMSSIDVQPTQQGKWKFTVWAINALGYRSAPASITVELLALSQPPDDVTGFQMEIYNDAANLQWVQSSALDVIVGGQVVIRFSTRMSTDVTWEEANEIARFSGSSTNGFVPLMKGVYLAKFINSSDSYSKNAAFVISTTGPLRDYNVVEDLEQQPDFSGEKVNTVVRNTILYMEQNDDGYLISTDAGYYFDRIVDLGKVYTCRCTSYLSGAKYDLFDDVDTWADWDARADVDGTKIDEGGGIVLASLTNVDPATAIDDDWSPWNRLVASDLTFRAARFSLVLHVKEDTSGIGVTELGATVDVPDRMESRNNVQVAAGGTYITFNTPFKDTPAISIIAQGLAAGDQWLIDQQAPEGFRIQFTNSGGAPIARTCDWIARGYGYEHVDLVGIGWSRMARLDSEILQTMRARIGPKGVKARTP